MAWSNPRLIELSKKFVPCADEVWRLQNQDDFDCILFRRFSELGHYRNHGSTRQGVYLATPSGRFLGSVNTRDATKLEALLRDALKRWKKLKRKERALSDEDRERLEALWRWEDEYPEDGLVLEVLVRDLPRDAAGQKEFEATQRKLPGWARWNDAAWNRDQAWFRKDEAARWIPEGTLRKGTEFPAPADAVSRLVRYNLVDCVRGQTAAWRPADVRKAELTARVERATRGSVELSLRGSVHCKVEGGDWPRELTLTLEGSATWNRRTDRFTSFEVVATGERTGRTRFNGRQDDPGPSPIGFVLRLAAEDAPRVAPVWVYHYGWEPRARK